MRYKTKFFLYIFMISLFTNYVAADYKKLAYDFNFTNLNGSLINLSDFEGKVIIVVNVASKCGFTNQYEDLENVWNAYKKKGLVVLGVPSNDFGNQEPGTSSEIKTFCETKFGITFPMTQKLSVKGIDAHPFYLWAKKNFGKSAIPKWNFHKIIIDKEGKIAETFTSLTNPSSKKFIKTLEKLI